MSVVIQLVIFRASDVGLVSRIESALQADVGSARIVARLLDEQDEIALVCNCALFMDEAADGVVEFTTGGMFPRPTWDPDTEVVHFTRDFHGLKLRASETEDPAVLDLLVTMDTAPMVTPPQPGSRGTAPGEPVRVEHFLRLTVDDAVTVLAGGDLIVMARPVLMEEPGVGLDRSRWEAVSRGTRRERAAEVERLLGPELPVHLPVGFTREGEGYRREGW